MSDKEQEKADAQRQYLERIETGGELAVTRYEPRDLPSLMDFSQMVARSGLCPKALQGKPSDVALVVVAGAERGLTLMQSLQNLNVIYGKISMGADIIRAKCQAHPDCKHFEVVKATPTEAVLHVAKTGWKEHAEVKFTVEDAKRAGLVKADSGWSKWPEDMCVARVTSRAARRYFPDVMAGILEATEAAEVAATEGRPVGKPSDKAQKLAETLHEAAQGKQEPKATDDTVDAEYVEEEPVQPQEGVAERLAEAAAEDEAAEEADPDAWLKELLGVGGVGEMNGKALISAGYVSWLKIHAATEAELRQVAGVGERTAKNLKREAAKVLGDTEEEPEETPEPPAEEPSATEEEAPPKAPATGEVAWKPLPPPETLKQRPVFRGNEWMEGLRKMCLDYGSTWGQIVEKAREISGGYDPARLSDPEWSKLIAWLKSAKQETLPVADKTEGEEEPPKFELVRDHERYSEEVISPKKKAQILRWAKKTGKEEADVNRFLEEEWAARLDSLPEQLYIPVLEWASAETDEDYQEAVGFLVESGQARRLA